MDNVNVETSSQANLCINFLFCLSQALYEKSGGFQLPICLEQLPYIGVTLGISLDMVACFPRCGLWILLGSSVQPWYVMQLKAVNIDRYKNKMKSSPDYYV